MVKKKVAKVLKASKKEPQTMEELLALTNYKISGLRRGQTVSGTVTAISGKAVLVDIGAKNEGMITGREFSAARDFIKTLKVGSRVSSQVGVPESESGQILLSLKKMAFSSAWEKLSLLREKNQEIEVGVEEATRAGLLVEAFGLTGFVPHSQIGSLWQGKTGELVGKKIKVKVMEIDPAQERLVFSEKAVSEKEKIAEQEAAMKKVKIGEDYKGVVTGVTPFGVFVQIKVGAIPLEGLVHISEIAWEKVEDPSLLLKGGDELKVKIIGVDKAMGRLSLSVKQLTNDPWFLLVEKYPLETQLKGRVTRLSNFGAFVEIEPNLSGLLHISNIPPEKKINVGDVLSCFVEGVEPEKRRLSLGLVLKEKPVGYK